MRMTIRARLLALMQIERYQAFRLDEATADGRELHVVSRERAAVRWAIEEPGRLNRDAYLNAILDLRRFEEARRTRTGGAPPA
jgi:hypothetical protein